MQIEVSDLFRRQLVDVVKFDVVSFECLVKSLFPLTSHNPVEKHGKIIYVVRFFYLYLQILHH